MPLKACCVLLCGGKSSRMKRDKCFLPFRSQSLVRWQFERLCGIFGKCFISTKNDKFNGDFKDMILDEKMPDFDENSRNLSENSRFFNKNSQKNLRLKDKDFSPMLALYSILNALSSDFAFIIPVDMPFVKESSIKKMLESAEKSPFAKIIIPKTPAKTHFLCGLYHKSLASLCFEFLCKNQHKIALLSQNAPCEVLEFFDENEFVNLNNLDEYERFKDV